MSGRINLAGLWPAAEAVSEAVRQTGETASALEEAEVDLATLRQQVLDAEHESVAAREHHETLRATVGAAVAELERQLTDVANLFRVNDTERVDAERERDTAIGARGRADGRREELAAALLEATEERATAAESFQRFAAAGLLTVALPELALPSPGETWAPDPNVRLARRVNDELADVAGDEQTWDRAQ